jgi:hypothetical protein
VLFNPLEQERLSVVSLLVNSPRVQVLSEEGQPLAVQISVHWRSATDVVPDVYQVRLGSAGGPASAGSACQWPVPGASLPMNTCFPLLCCCLAYSPGWGQCPGEGSCPGDSHSWGLSLSLKEMWKVSLTMTVEISHHPFVQQIFIISLFEMGSCVLPRLVWNSWNQTFPPQFPK